MDRAKYKIKNSAFEGVPVWVSLVPKVYFRVKTMCTKFHMVPTLGCNLLRVTVLTIFTQASNAVTAVARYLCGLENFLTFLFQYSIFCFNIQYSVAIFNILHSVSILGLYVKMI